MTNPFHNCVPPLGGPACDLVPITPSNVTPLAHVAVALYVETAGTIAVVTASGDSRSFAISDVVNRSLGGGLYTVEATFTPTSNATTGSVGIGPNSVTTGATITVLGAQIELGSKATSLILSTRSPADHAADVVTFKHWTDTYDVTIAYSDGASETRFWQALAPGYVLTPLAHRRVLAITQI